MKKSLTKLMAIMLLATSALTIHAQITLWPLATDSATIKASQFADTSQIFWSRTGNLTPPAGFTGWVTRGLTSAGTGTTQKDSARWIWKRDASPSGGQFATGLLALASPSKANGAAIFNSDLLDFSGVTAPHSGELVSPAFNAAGYNDVSVIFYQYFRNFQSSLYISYSNDDGVTWSTKVPVSADITANVATLNPDFKAIILKGSVGSSKFRIKFIFDGNYYFWLIDDVKVVNNFYDLRINPFFALPPNNYMPKTQLEPMRFLADVYNASSLPMNNMKLSVNIWRAADGTKVFTSTTTAAQYPVTAKPDTVLENRLLPDIFNPSTLTAGQYIGSYRVSGDSSIRDVNAANDTARFTFVVSDTTAALSVVVAGVGRSNFTKEDANQTTTRNADSYWTATEPKSWRFGNCYRVVDGKNQSFSTIIARLNPFAAAGRSLLGTIYEWNDANKDGIIQGGERNIVAAADTTVPAAQANANAWFIFKLVDINTGKSFVPKDNTNYLAMVEFDAPTPAATPVYLQGVFNNSYDYSAMRYVTALDSNNTAARRYSIVLGKTSSSDWSTAGYSTTTLTPCVRLNVVPFIVSDVTNLLSADNKLTISPNPSGSASFVTADVELAKESAAVIDIYTLEGKLVAEQVVDKMGKTQVQLDISEYVSGMYIFKLTTPNGIMSKRFVVSK